MDVPRVDNWEELCRLGENRDEWKTLVRGVKTSNTRRWKLFLKGLELNGFSRKK